MSRMRPCATTRAWPQSLRQDHFPPSPLREPARPALILSYAIRVGRSRLPTFDRPPTVLVKPPHFPVATRTSHDHPHISSICPVERHTPSEPSHPVPPPPPARCFR